jgi:hypothetical protein
VGASVTFALVRGVVTAAVVAALALTVAGCGGKKEPPRSALAENLAHLCEQARADTEALGLPAEQGFKVVKPTAKIGLRLARQIKQLEGSTPAEKEQIASLAEYYRFYWNELLAGAKLVEAGQGTEIYTMTADRAKGTLVSAEALATRMGAPECAVRPFPDR